MNMLTTHRFKTTTLALYFNALIKLKWLICCKSNIYLKSKLKHFTLTIIYMHPLKVKWSTN